MDFSNFSRFAWVLGIAVATAGMVFWLARWWMRGSSASEREKAGRALDGIDTVAGWPPQVTRALRPSHLKAYKLLQRSLPDRLILAQVPLSRFVQVPTRHSYAEWMRRIGHATVDLMICDRRGRVMAVIDLRSHGKARDESTRKRQQRMAQVLEAAQVPMHVWDETHLPEPGSIRRAFSSLAAGTDPGPDTRPMAPEVHPPQDPPASGWFDELHATRPTRLDAVEVIHSDHPPSDFAPTHVPIVAKA